VRSFGQSNETLCKSEKYAKGANRRQQAKSARKLREVDSGPTTKEREKRELSSYSVVSHSMAARILLGQHSARI
jgi:hypothetical protein